MPSHPLGPIRSSRRPRRLSRRPSQIGPKSLYAFEQRFWEQGFTRIAGVDEAGRGPLAGPVVAAAVILTRRFKIPGLNDSKQLSPEKRENLFASILERSRVGVGLVSEKVIDEINIFQAARLAMKKAIQELPEPPDALLIDGRMKMESACPCREIIHGDALSASIAAASIVAKVVRDRIMMAYHELEPYFLFNEHKGYGTGKHLFRLQEKGPSVFHRMSFRPIKKDPQEALL